MNDSLYNLSGDFAELRDMLTDPDADQEAVSDTLEGLQLEIADKVDGYAAVYAEIEGKKATITEEIKRLTDLKKACDNAQDRMKSYAGLHSREPGLRNSAPPSTRSGFARTAALFLSRSMRARYRRSISRPRSCRSRTKIRLQRN